MEYRCDFSFEVRVGFFLILRDRLSLFIILVTFVELGEKIERFI